MAVFGNNSMQTWGLNNLFKVITSSGVGRVSRVQIRHAEMWRRIFQMKLCM